MKRAIYPGSFDPLTSGHIDIINRAAQLFDEVIVVIAKNVEKNALFSVEERKDMILDTLKEIKNIRVISYSGLTVNCAKEYNAKYIVRGLRIVTDFEYEFQMSMMNHALESEIESVYFMTKPENTTTSSSVVKEVHALGGDVSKFVPESIIKLMDLKKQTKER